MNLLNKLTFINKDQYETLKKENEKLVAENDEVKYDFDKLLAGYTPEQLNALVYKAINICYNTPSKKSLLERWQIRLNGILKTN